MKILKLVAAVLLPACASAQVIIGDNFNATANGTGFSPGAGINAGINPPTTTRLTGSAAANLRYLNTGTKADTAFSIASNKLRVTSAANPGRFVYSANGTAPFDFAAALGSSAATPANPAVYDVAITIANSTVGNQRCSFALAAAEGDATTWDFGVQLFHTAASDNFYTIGKRVDTAASGLAADLNMFITNTVPGTGTSEVTFLLRITDAGAETNTFNSRVQVSVDAGARWIYDTETDPDLPNGWRFDGPGRYIIWDIAPDAGPVTYDNFSVRRAPLNAALTSPANNASGFGANANLKTTVSNSVPGNVTVTFFGHEAAKPGPGPDFLITVLPDTQNYSDYSHDGLHGRFYSQTEWIITNRVSKNIAFVAQLGDIVQNGDIVNGGPNDEEWQVSTNAMYRLENPARTLLRYGIPYGCCVGNHDQEPNGDEDGTTTHFNQYFGTAHFTGKPYYGGHYSANNDSFFNLFSAGGMDFIVFSYEYGRYGSGVLDWTDDVLATNANRRIIVMTHHAGSDYTPSNLSAQGDAIFDRLKTRANFFLMLGGHVFNGDGWGEGSRSDTVSGHTIRTLVSDYQNRPSGGDGLMRLMYFSPSNNTVSIKTYSPYTDTFETDADSQFSFSYNMQPNGAGSPGTAYVPIKTNLNVTPGSQTTSIWPGLQPNKTYEWYVTVTDAAGNSFRSDVRRLTTGVNAAPLVSNVTVTVTGDQPSNVNLPSAFDANGDAVTYRITNPPLRGLASNLDTNSGALTYLPAHGFRGLDRINYQAYDSVAFSSAGTLNLNVIAPPDTNANGLPDAWETTYGVTDPNGDDDGDGQSNLAEFMANTNPTNAASRVQILSGNLVNGNFVLNWSSIGGTRYRVQYADGSPDVFTDIVRPVDTEMDASPLGTASTQIFTDNFSISGTPNGVRFYRVKVVP